MDAYGDTHPGTGGDAFLAALDDAEELLKYLGEVGHPVPAPVISDILKAREAVTAHTDNAEMRAAFYAAFTQLSAICGDVTARTIRNCSSPQTLRSLGRNRSPGADVDNIHCRSLGPNICNRRYVEEDPWRHQYRQCGRCFLAGRIDRRGR